MTTEPDEQAKILKNGGLSDETLAKIAIADAIFAGEGIVMEELMTTQAKALEVFLPPELLPFEADLRLFFDMMILKLRLNKSKGFAEGAHPIDMFNGLDGEVVELRDALLRESQEAVLSEAADCANMAWLCALAAIRMDKIEYKKQQPGGIST